MLAFVGLVLIYLAAWTPPLGSPAVVSSVFYMLGAGVIYIKFELAGLPKINQMTTVQAGYTVVALVLSWTGGLVSHYYGTLWWGGLIVAILGAIIMAYQDYGGQLPTTTS